MKRNIVTIANKNKQHPLSHSYHATHWKFLNISTSLADKGCFFLLIYTNFLAMIKSTLMKYIANS